MSRMLYHDKDGEWIAAGSMDWLYQRVAACICPASSPIRTSILACCIHYVRYRHLDSLQVVQAFTRDSIVSMSTGHSFPVD